MVASIQQLIGKVNPILYAENGKELLKKYGSLDKIPAEEVKPVSLAEHTLIYDSSSETLEPIYFFILDLMNDFGLAPEKLIDTFVSSPGSGHFSELGQRATIMQQQGSKILGDVNTVLRSVLNVIYDLKEFRIRLQSYDDLKTDKKESAMLSLKQIWMDKVDIQKQQSSIKAMALGQAGFQTLINAFLASKTIQDVDKLDLNEMVKRILKPRIHEFNVWVIESERELRKRYEIEKTYLRSQVNSLKLYSRWAKPYLRAAQQLEMQGNARNPALVKTFNTIILELTLLGKSKIKIKESALEGLLPSDFTKESFLKTFKRNYYGCVLVDFMFRGIPQRVAQQSHYAFGGRAEVTFRAYALNDDEIAKLNKELDQSDIDDPLKLIEGTTTESLEQLKEDINFFLEEKKDEKEKSKSPSKLSEFFPNIKKDIKETFFGKPKSNKEEGIKPDTYIEKEHIRPLAINSAIENTFGIFNTYKKGHGMANYG